MKIIINGFFFSLLKLNTSSFHFNEQAFNSAPLSDSNFPSLNFRRQCAQEAAQEDAPGAPHPGATRAGAVAASQGPAGGADDAGRPAGGVPGRDPAHLEDPAGHAPAVGGALSAGDGGTSRSPVADDA